MRLLIAILVILSLSASAQETLRLDGMRSYSITEPSIDYKSILSVNPFSEQRNYEVISHYDTTVLDKGIDTITHVHNWVGKNVNHRMFAGGTCLVSHGAAGCPDTWLYENQICTICLRHINVKESRSIKSLEPPKDPYDEAVERLNKRRKNK